jgi:hypothetical protein
MSLINKKSLRDKIIKGVEEGAAKALMQHKRDNRSIHIWQDGRVVEIPPEKIEICKAGSDDQK